MSESIYGTGSKAGFDTYGNRLPDYPTVQAGIRSGNTSLFAGMVNKQKIQDSVTELVKETGFKNYTVRTTMENQGLKAFGFIVKDIGYINVTMEYDSEEESIAASND